MKSSFFITLFFFSLVLQSCSHSTTCEQLLSENAKSDRDEFPSVEKIYDGYNMPIESRFNFSCVYLNGIDISSDVNTERKNDDLFSIKLLTPEKYRLRNNDTIKVFFTDKRTLVWEWSGIMQVDFIIKKEVTPCDSVFNIVYKDISGKIDEIITNEKVEIKQLYEFTLKNKIKQYISSLSKADSIKFNECQKNFFILDLINNDDNFGFVENHYYLTPKLKDYLSTIAESIAFDIKQHDWSQSQFIIKCVGYADRNRFTGIPTINYSNLGIIDSTKLRISRTDCGLYGGFEELGKTNSELPELKNVLNNCDLSVLRSYVTVEYLKKRLSDLTNSKFTFQYRGGGEIDNTAFEANRKIDLYIQIKGVSDK